MARKGRRRRKKADSYKVGAHPLNYVLVRTREGDHWRQKRGSVKKATLNKAFQQNVDLVKLASPAAKNLKNILHPFIKKLDTGRFIANVSSLFRKAYKKNGKMDFSLFKDYDIQPYRQLSHILNPCYSVSCKKGEVVIDIDITESPVKRLNDIVSEYFFDAVLVYGDPSKTNGLRIESDTSPLFPFHLQSKVRKKANCRLSVVLPLKKTSWMVLLKVSCMEEDILAKNPRHYGMKVVMVSGKI